MVRRFRKRDSDLSWEPPHSPSAPANNRSEDEEEDVVEISDITSSRNLHPTRGQSRAISSSDNLIGNLLVLGVGAVLVLSMMWVGVLAVGVVNPVIQTLKAMDKRNREYERRWAAYWVVLATFVVVHWIPRLLLRWIPGYPVLLMAFLWWLSRNNAENASYLFELYGRPFFKKNEAAIDQVGEQLVEHVDRFGKMLMIKTNEVIAPYAKKLSTASRRYHRQLSTEERGVRRHRRLD